MVARQFLVLSLLCIAAGLQAKTRLLEPSAFPQLPPHVVADLEQRDCKIPEFNRHTQDVVIQGHFMGPNTVDWAVLCMRTNSTSLLVYPGGSVERLVAPDIRWNSFTSWGIAPVDSKGLENVVWGWQTRKPQVFDHQGISSSEGYGTGTSVYSFSSEAVTFYFENGEWLRTRALIAN